MQNKYTIPKNKNTSMSGSNKEQVQNVLWKSSQIKQIYLLQVNANTKSFEDGDDDEEEYNALNDDVDNYNDDANE